ncbi:MAG: gliding motility protein GldM [Vicingaceae bacterium]
MAGNKLPPRQKMIGMMYLVLTALLAMNVSKDILDAFIIVNDGLEKTNTNFMDKINVQYANFEKSFSENPAKVKPFYDRAKDVKLRSDELYAHIMQMKANIIAATEGYENLQAAIGKDANGNDTTVNIKFINAKDNYDVLTNILVGSEPESPKDGELTARELKEKMIAYRDALLGYATPGSSLEASLNATFNFENLKDASGTVNTWESYNFYHIPLAAALTIMSKLQGDIRNAESDVVKQLYANVDAGSIKFNKIDAAIIPTSNYIIQGDSFKAEVFLAAYDSTKNPKMYFGKNIDSTTWEITSDDRVDMKVVGGKGQMAIKGTSEGEFTYHGIINFHTDDGRDILKPFKTTYTVARPSLVVSADKMNVFYKGVDNPVSISVPGVPADKLSPSISNGSLTRGKDGFIVRVKGGNEAVIRVSADMPAGGKKSMGEMKFRVKSIPNPVPYVAGETGSANVKKVILENSSKVFAKMENFDFDLTPIVTGYVFSTTVSGGALVEEKVRGASITGSVKNLISKSKKNSKVYFEKIEVKMPDGSTRELGPVSLKLQ